MDDLGAAEEEHLTATLLEGLVREFSALPPHARLAAVEGAAARPSSKQFTVGHAAIRHTAVPMEQYLPDLVVGLWLGSSSDRTLQAAQGTSRTTRPRFALTIDVVLEPMLG
ncbi:hypothetical protein [Streptomyces sp. NPDC051364]|uniref:hypothetical protein n=1 Tax=Streptomyces sp. NPDC051364 TaxID=3155799 RepID=UPI003429E7A3